LLQKRGESLFVLFLIVKIILYLLIFIISLVLLFIIIPIEYEFNSKIDEKIIANVKLSFFKSFFKIMVKYKNKETLFLIKVMGVTAIRKEIKNPSKKIKKENLKEKKNTNFNIKDYVEKEFIKDLLNYFKDIIDIIKPKVVKINGTYGFEDPSLTGMACGIIPIVTNLIPSSKINLQPVFDDEIIDIYCEVYGRIFLLIVAIKTLKFVLKKNNRRKIFKKLKKSETY